MQPILAMPRPKRTEVVIDVAGVTLILSTAELDALLSKLGDARAQMLPPQPLDTDPLEPISVVQLRRFFLQQDAETKEVLLQMRHPAFGWLAWQLPLHQAREMREMLAGYENPAGE